MDSCGEKRTSWTKPCHPSGEKVSITSCVNRKTTMSSSSRTYDDPQEDDKDRHTANTEPSCIICLGPIVDRTILPVCSHDAFCFECLLVWTGTNISREQKRTELKKLAVQNYPPRFGTSTTMYTSFLNPDQSTHLLSSAPYALLRSNRISSTRFVPNTTTKSITYHLLPPLPPFHKPGPGQSRITRAFLPRGVGAKQSTTRKSVQPR